MIPGKSHPRPYQRLWVGAYTDKKSEYFELRTADKTGKFSYSPLWHKYAPLGSAITDFLYDDLKRFDSDLSAVKRRVDAVNAGQGREQALQELFDLARLWLNDNPLYAPLAAAAERLELSAESGDPLNTDELERMMEEYRTWQPKLKAIAHSVLETEDNETCGKGISESRRKTKPTFLFSRMADCILRLFIPAAMCHTPMTIL